MTDEHHPPGWFPDPLDRYDHRWFNGTAWTSDVSTDGRRHIDPHGISSGDSPGAPPDNRAGTASLICGLVGIALAWIPVLVVVGVVLAVLAIIFGITGRQRSRRTGTGGGRSAAGIVTGGIGSALAVVGVVLTIQMVGEIVAFVEPGPRFVDDVACTESTDRTEVSGTLTNLDDRRRDYVVFVTVDGRTDHVEVDGIDPGARTEWVVSHRSGSPCDPVVPPEVTVTGPFPYGIVTEPVPDS